LFNLGSIDQAPERGTDAESARAQGLAISRAIGDRRGEANAPGDLGVVYAAPGPSENAIRHLQEAVAIADEIADEAWAERMRERRTRIKAPLPSDWRDDHQPGDVDAGQRLVAA